MTRTARTPLSAIHRTRDGTALTFTFALDAGAVAMSDTPFGTAIAIDGFTPTGCAGAPQLPRLQMCVTTPENTWPTAVSVITDHWIPITGPGVFVAASQPRSATADRSATGSDYRPPDLSAYRRAVAHPPDVVTRRDVENIGGVRVAVLDIAPVKLTPDGRILLCTRATGIIHCDAPPADRSRRPAARPGTSVRRERLRSSSVSGTVEGPSSSTTPPTPPQRVVITRAGHGLPATDRFVTDTSPARARLTLDAAPVVGAQSLVACVGDADRRPVPFKTTRSPAVRGWYYAVAPDDPSMSCETIVMPPLRPATIPAPTRWIVVHGDEDDRCPHHYEIVGRLFDAAVE